MVSYFLQLIQATVAYYLLLDNRFRPSSGYLGAEFQETMVRPLFVKLFYAHKVFISNIFLL
jgi:hypothetical protein